MRHATRFPHVSPQPPSEATKLDIPGLECELNKLLVDTAEYIIVVKFLSWLILSNTQIITTYHICLSVLFLCICILCLEGWLSFIIQNPNHPTQSGLRSCKVYAQLFTVLVDDEKKSHKYTQISVSNHFVVVFSQFVVYHAF